MLSYFDNRFDCPMSTECTYSVQNQWFNLNLGHMYMYDDGWVKMVS